MPPYDSACQRGGVPMILLATGDFFCVIFASFSLQGIVKSSTKQVESMVK